MRCRKGIPVKSFPVCCVLPLMVLPIIGSLSHLLDHFFSFSIGLRAYGILHQVVSPFSFLELGGFLLHFCCNCLHVLLCFFAVCYPSLKPRKAQEYGDSERDCSNRVGHCFIPLFSDRR